MPRVGSASRQVVVGWTVAEARAPPRPEPEAMSPSAPADDLHAVEVDLEQVLEALTGVELVPRQAGLASARKARDEVAEDTVAELRELSRLRAVRKHELHPGVLLREAQLGLVLALHEALLSRESSRTTINSPGDGRLGACARRGDQTSTNRTT